MAALIILHDNATPRGLLGETSHSSSPYSPDISPFDIDLLPKQKENIDGLGVIIIAYQNQNISTPGSIVSAGQSKHTHNNLNQFNACRNTRKYKYV